MFSDKDHHSLRLDFVSFTLTGPQEDNYTSAVDSVVKNSHSIVGQCLSDTMIIVPGERSQSSVVMMIIVLQERDQRLRSCVERTLVNTSTPACQGRATVASQSHSSSVEQPSPGLSTSKLLRLMSSLTEVSRSLHLCKIINKNKIFQLELGYLSIS